MSKRFDALGTDLEFLEVENGVWICIVGPSKMAQMIAYRAPLSELHIHELELTVRSTNCLLAEEIDTIGKLIDTDVSFLQKIPNMGRKSIKDILLALDRKGLKMRDSTGIAERLMR